MEFNSDYEVRLATLGVLGGDTTKKYDSVYSIDLEILKLTEQGGGGGGMTYDQMKQLLASSGLTEIVFNDGASSITLDYDLVAQIGQGGESNYYIRDTYDELSAITGDYNGYIAYVKEHQGTEDVKDLMYDYMDGSVNLIFTYSGDSETYRIDLAQNGNQLHVINGRFYGKYDGQDWNDEWIYNARDHRDNNPENFPITVRFNNGAEIMFSSVTNGEEWSSWEENKLDFKVYKYNGQFPELTEDAQTDISVIDSGYTEETLPVTIQPKGWFIYNNAVSGDNKWLEYDIYIDNLTPDELDAMMNRYYAYRQALFIRKKVGNQNDKVYARFEAGQVYWNQDSENPRKEVRFATSMLDDAYSSENWYMLQVVMDGESNYKWTQRSFEQKLFVREYQIDQVRTEMNRRVGTDWETIREGFQSGSLFSFAPSGSATFEVWSYEITKESSAQDMNWLGQFVRRGGSGRAIWTDFYNESVRWWNDDNTGVWFDADNSWQLIGYSWNRRENVNAYGVCAMKLVDNGSTMTLYMATSKEGTAVGQDNEFYVDPNGEFSSGWVQESDEVISYQPHLYQIYYVAGVNNGETKLKRHTLI